MTIELDFTPGDSPLKYLGPGKNNRLVHLFRVEHEGISYPQVDVSVWPSYQGLRTEGSKVYPYDRDGTQGLERVTGPSHTTNVAEDDCEMVWTLGLDNRFAYDFNSQKELEQALRFALDFSAVTSGYTSSKRSHWKTRDGGSPVTVVEDPLVSEAA